MSELEALLAEIGACMRCVDLPQGPRPIVQAGQGARLRIVGQAPGRKVHETGIPWNDASGARLRAWLGLTAEQFYDPAKVAIMPIGFCYPGKATSGDNPPRSECAPRWHARLAAQLPAIGLTLLIGSYAQAHYLGDRRMARMEDTVRAWQDYLPLGFIPLPHPSPRNQPWLARNRWFEEVMVPKLRAAIHALAL